MLVYPQLTTGAVSQFPAQKRRKLRTVVNALGDGSSIKLADPPGELTEWQLQYAGLSDQEALALEQFFESVEGSLGVFTFLDPTANLFSWSGQLDHREWAGSRRRDERVELVELRSGGTESFTNARSAGRVCLLPECLRESIRGRAKDHAVVRFGETGSNLGNGVEPDYVFGERRRAGRNNRLRHRGPARRISGSLRHAGGATGGGFDLQAQHDGRCLFERVVS